MTDRSPAPLLPPSVVEQAKRIADAIRSAEVAPLVGAGTSVRAGVPSWNRLIDQIIRAWQQWDPSPAARRLSPDNYVRLVFQCFEGSNLATISYLRNKINAEGSGEKLKGFSQLLYSALYADPLGTPELFTPEPDHVHRHLVTLFSDHPRRLWTTNYDDLLEEAARLNGIPVRTLDPLRRQVNGDLLVAHVHGFLPPPDRAAGHPELTDAPVVLAEDDYHAVSADVLGWTNRELYRLFDEHRALIVGMSLSDPNVRRVLATLPENQASVGPRHFAVMSEIQPDELVLPYTKRSGRLIYADDVSDMRAWYWKQRGVEIVEIPDHDCLLPFLVRLRYESFGKKPGDFWSRAAEIGYTTIDPWQHQRQSTAKGYLDNAVHRLIREFNVADQAEVREIGIFLVKSRQHSLDLVFRGGSNVVAKQGEREFSIDPDAPTGVAGRVFVSGDLVRVSRKDPLYDYGLSAENADSNGGRVAGIVSAPIVDWEQGGIPLGVVYLTTTRTDGTVFSLQPRSSTEPGARSLDDLYVWLSDAALTLVSSFR